MAASRNSFTGLYGEYAIGLIRNLIHVVNIREIGMHNDWNINPHHHPNLFQIFCIEAGSIDLIIEDGQHHINSKTLFTVPKNVSHSLRLNPSVNGWAISLSDAFLQDMLKLDADIVFSLDRISITKIDLSVPTIKDVYTTYHKCVYEFENNEPGKYLALQCLSGLLILQLHRIPTASQEIVRFNENSSKLYFRRFSQLLKEPGSLTKSVNDFAAELAVTRSHLNRICKSVTGHSTQHHIISHTIAEAKKALANFELSISEIAYSLHFKDPAYFTRFFKKETGLTPKAYRDIEIMR